MGIHAGSASRGVLPKKQIYGPLRFCNTDFRCVIGLPKSIRRRCGDYSPRHDESRA
ncbi:hypothetical protein BN2476_750049 [Paraburkholderia piptadeniae]|uniref:Uncharacterized protein n=1 Tax=Paraburkholderia piptadeniae TaxID=1701573 RepID=A0A1N7SRW2_9BURK|nr:hypothetical protein BN2476_750049 [Paraburkholderia piptadeniae]